MRISLAETDRRWRYILAGRTYHGEAINPKSLSIFERYALRLHKVTTATFLVHILHLLCLSFATQLHKVLSASFLVHVLDLLCLSFATQLNADLLVHSSACATTGMYAQPHTISHMLHFASYLLTGVLARDQIVDVAFCM